MTSSLPATTAITTNSKTTATTAVAFTTMKIKGTTQKSKLMEVSDAWNYYFINGTLAGLLQKDLEIVMHISKTKWTLISKFFIIYNELFNTLYRSINWPKCWCGWNIQRKVARVQTRSRTYSTLVICYRYTSVFLCSEVVIPVYRQWHALQRQYRLFSHCCAGECELLVVLSPWFNQQKLQRFLLQLSTEM